MTQQMEITVGDVEVGNKIESILKEVEDLVTSRGCYIIGCIGVGDVAGSVIGGQMSISNMLACHHVIASEIENIIKADRIDEAFMNGGDDAISH